MAKKKGTTPKFGWCGTCAQPFDLFEAAKAARDGRALIHDCGRVLVRGRGNAEVPTHSHVYDPNPRDTSDGD